MIETNRLREKGGDIALCAELKPLARLVAAGDIPPAARWRPGRALPCRAKARLSGRLVRTKEATASTTPATFGAAASLLLFAAVVREHHPDPAQARFSDLALSHR